MSRSAWLVLALAAAASAAPPAAPRRIVSATVATDEMLSALVDKRRVQAVTDLALDPYSSRVVDWARDIPHKIPIRGGLNVEQIMACEPDLILVARYTRSETVKLLKDQGLPVLTLDAYASIKDIQANILKVGQAVGSEEKARGLVRWMDARLAAAAKTVARARSRPRVLHYTIGGFIAGRGTTQDDIIARAGGENVGAAAGPSGYWKISTEALIALDPDVILISAYDPAKGDVAAQLYADPALRGLKAVRARRIYSLPGRDLGAVDQFIVYGVEEAARALHPELFGQAR